MNVQNRHLLLATATRENYYLQPVTINPNSTARINLVNVGLTTNLRVELSYSTTALASPFYNFTNPGSLFTAKFIDYDTTVRFNVRDVDVAILNLFRKGKDDFLSNLFLTPSSSLYINQYVFDLPLALHKEADLRGAVWTNVSGGTATLEITNTSSNTLDVSVVQEFLLPQPINGVLPIPQIDINTVNEMMYITATDNLLPNSYKYIDLPNNRTVLETWTWYYDGKYLESPLFELVENANTVILKYDDLTSYLEQDRHLIQPLKDTSYRQILAGLNPITPQSQFAYMPIRYFNYETQPLLTNLYGAIQYRFMPSSVNSGAFVTTLFNNLYVKGQVGGVQQ
ncbi:MAG TPA: hypothetical protein ENO40_04470 [Desulfurella acetivorans]|nr:hypothetical protein [Desulfurella acetivorans]